MSPRGFRLDAGGRLDRSRPVGFRFDGKVYRGYAGDTLASALLANGVHLVGRSFKYHRPRGIMTAGPEEPNALVQLERAGGRSDPNLRATEVEIYDGLESSSQNRWPSVRYDVGVVNDALAPFIPAGFYYKTFMGPGRLWHRLYEPVIRAAAGLGRAPREPDPDRYLHRHAHCDVLVVGGGPAGLAAALAAGRSGARVILVESSPELGGWLLSESGRASRVEGGAAWPDAAAAELRSLPEVTVLTRTTAFGYYDHNYLGLLERVADHLPVPTGNLPRQRLWRVRAREVVLATGAVERPLVFAGNDRPGIMLAGSARTYLNRYAVRPGDRALVFTNNDTAYAAALDAAAAGMHVAGVVDLRPDPDGPLPRAVRAAGIPVHGAAAVVGTKGRSRVHTVLVRPLADGGREGGVDELGEARPFACDCLLVSGGWSPATQLFSQSRGRARFDDAAAAFVPDVSAQAERSAGGCAGTSSLGDAFAAGAAAGVEATRAADPPDLPHVEESPEAPLLPTWLVPAPAKPGRAFVDFQNDVTAKDLGLALREGFTSIEHVKRYTTTGMGTDQGRTSNVNALAIVAGRLGVGIEEVGTTTSRPPFTPVTFGALAGVSREELFEPVRTTPIHGWHVAKGAVFEDVGAWKRARYYPRLGEDMHAAVARECRAVRETVGLFDATTLGKIDVQGRDAAEFLDRIYTNVFSNLQVGRCRYGLMLKDDGYVLDDGVTSRLAEDRFHMTTTTGGAARILAWLEEWLQTEWPDLRVYCTSVTEEWAVPVLAGPKARDVLRAAGTDLDLSPEAFPHLSWREGTVAGVPARVFRVSFSGETGYEVNVPAGQGRRVWEALAAAGRSFGLIPYGTEAMHVLRAEKGYIIVGQETDGTVTPLDLGMGWIVSKKKPDFVGKRGLARSALQAAGRRQLVGLLTDDPVVVLEEGAQVVAEAGPPSLGHVASSYASPALGRSIALALVVDGAGRHGETLHVAMPAGPVPVRVAGPVFHDPEGKRLHG